jgi:hypothetical protein
MVHTQTTTMAPKATLLQKFLAHKPTLFLPSLLLLLSRPRRQPFRR